MSCLISDGVYMFPEGISNVWNHSHSYLKT